MKESEGSENLRCVFNPPGADEAVGPDDEEDESPVYEPPTPTDLIVEAP